MNCQQIRDAIVLRAYGELGEEEQVEVELHLHGCAECRGVAGQTDDLIEFMSWKPLPEVPPNMLAKARMRLDEALDMSPSLRPWDRVRNLFGSTMRVFADAPALTIFLVGMGFVGGHAWERYQVAHEDKLPPVVRIDRPGDSIVGAIQGVVATGDNETIQVKYTRVVPETVQGSLSDPEIRHLLMTAAQQGTDQGVREQSVDLLATACRAGQRCEDHEDGSGFRDTLLERLRYDKSPQVRMKALEGLQPFMRADRRVRDAVLESVAGDASPSIRVKAIGMLQPVRADSSVRQVLQTVGTKDENPYIRNASMQVLGSDDGIE